MYVSIHTRVLISIFICRNVISMFICRIHGHIHIYQSSRHGTLSTRVLISMFISMYKYVCVHTYARRESSFQYSFQCAHFNVRHIHMYVPQFTHFNVWTHTTHSNAMTHFNVRTPLIEVSVCACVCVCVCVCEWTHTQLIEVSGHIHMYDTLK